MDYATFNAIALKYYNRGGKHFIECWDSKKYYWYAKQCGNLTEKSIKKLIAESKKNRW